VSWHATFATSTLVLGYHPKSRFAQELRTKPWYQVVGWPGFFRRTSCVQSRYLLDTVTVPVRGHPGVWRLREYCCA
jgi:hypothetical protein